MIWGEWLGTERVPAPRPILCHRLSVDEVGTRVGSSRQQHVDVVDGERVVVVQRRDEGSSSTLLRPVGGVTAPALPKAPSMARICGSLRQLHVAHAGISKCL